MNWDFKADGIEAIAYCVAQGERLMFTRVVMGTGISPDHSEIVEPLPEMPDGSPVTEVEATGEKSIAVKTVFSNLNLQEEKIITEVGIYVRDPENSNRELLFVYGTGTYRYLPASTSAYESGQIFYITFTEDVEAAAEISKSLVYVTKKEYDDDAAATAQRMTALSGLIATLTNRTTALENRMTAAERALATMLDATYAALYFDKDSYSELNDLSDGSAMISYEQYQDEIYTSDIYITDDGSVPVQSDLPIFFRSVTGGNDDEITNSQLLLYSNGTMYRRERILWDYQAGVIPSPTFGSWNTETLDYYKQYFRI